LTLRKTVAFSLLLVALLVGGCLKHVPPTRLDTTQPTRVAYVLSYPDRSAVSDVPERVRKRVDGELSKRGFAPEDVGSQTWGNAFESRRTTRDRLQWLFAHTETKPFTVLVETRVRYYSLIDGRYRWNVAARVTFVRGKDLTNVVTRDFELASFLDYEHQDEHDALEYVDYALSERIGRAADQFVQGLADVPPGPPKHQETSSKKEEPTPRAPVGMSQGAIPSWDGQSIYYVMVDRFADGDSANDMDADTSDPSAFHGGDFQGIIDHLDYLQDLGVTTIWLSPVFEMRDAKFHGHGAFHGYWVEDFGKIEDRFGGLEQLQKLRAKLRERGMRLILDVVLNHVAFDAPLVTEHPDWFHHQGGITDWSDPEQLLTHDVQGLPDLAQEKPAVYQYLLRHSLHWIDVLHPDGFRLDAVKHVGLDFWKKYDAAIAERGGENFLLLGEQLDGDPAKVADVASGGGFNAMFDFPMYFAMRDVFCDDASVGRLAATLSDDRLYPDAIGPHRTGLVTLLDNHDLPRIMTACHDDSSRVVDAMAFMLTARGTPSFTWGTASGMKGEHEPENRKSMVFRDSPVGTAMKRLLQLRNAHPVLASGKDRILRLDEDVFAYLRVGDEAAMVVVNKGKKPANLPLPDGASGGRALWPADGSTSIGTAGITVPGGSVSAFLLDADDFSALLGPDDKRKVTFQIAGAPKGDVRVVGSGPELGNWDPAKAPHAGATVSIPAGTVLAYKAARLGADGKVTWQSGDNRYVFVGSDTAPTTVETSWK